MKLKEDLSFGILLSTESFLPQPFKSYLTSCITVAPEGLGFHLRVYVLQDLQSLSSYLCDLDLASQSTSMPSIISYLKDWILLYGISFCFVAAVGDSIEGVSGGSDFTTNRISI
jgi:hypothetical protein